MATLAVCIITRPDNSPRRVGKPTSSLELEVELESESADGTGDYYTSVGTMHYADRYERILT